MDSLAKDSGHLLIESVVFPLSLLPISV